MQKTEQPAATSSEHEYRQHVVKFFVEESDLYESLANYVREGLEADQGVLVAATRAHWTGLTLHLSNAGIQIDQVIDRGQLAFLDAEEARDELMVKGQPSQERFQALVAQQASELIEQWSGLRVYDEIVDILAADSQFGPMRQLDEMWRALRRRGECSLFSGYRLENFGGAADEELFDKVCRAHQQVYAAGDAGGQEVARWQRRALALGRRLEEEREERKELEEDLERERARNQRKDEFVGKFAHELRNPLAPILSAIEMMNLRGDTTTERERGIIERQVTRLVDLVDDFVDASRVMFDRAEPQAERVETSDVIRRAIQRATPTMERRDQKLHVDVEQAGLSVSVDSHRLAQAVAEMLENAANFTPEGGNIWLHAQREAGSVAISVRDDGTGLDPALLADVFEMFVRGERSEGIEHRGLGLGLAMVRKIAEMHDGAVAAYSDGPGNGSEFVMRLPRAERVASRPKVSRLRQGEVASGGSVLVVDDNEDFANMLSETLDLLGHDVRRANSAQEALETVGDFWPDVALLDINLPGMTGHELAEHLKQRCAADRQLRLVAVTGYSDERKRQRSEQMGFDAHLVKPIVLSQLQETLELVLGGD